MGFGVPFFLPVADNDAGGDSGAAADVMDRGGGDTREMVVDVPFMLSHGTCKWATASVIQNRASSTAFEKCITAWVKKMGKERR